MLVVTKGHTDRFVYVRTGALPEIFQDREGFVEFGHFDKLFVKNTKKGPAGNSFGAFSPRYS